MRPSSLRVPNSLLGFWLGIAEMVFPAAADVIIDWDNIAASTIRADTTLPGPTHSSRALAMVHLAMYDCVNTIHRTHQPYLVNATAPVGTSIDAAASQAAHDILVSVYPIQSATLDADLAAYHALIADGADKDNGIALGIRVAEELIRVRSVDNSRDETPFYPDGTEPGEWRRTPPVPIDPFGPEWGYTTPFGLRSGSQIPVPPLPDLSSPEYAANFNEVKDYGALISPSRTPDQTEIGIFWAYDRPKLGPPPILYNQILQKIGTDQGNTVEENARLFALANMAQADAGIQCWHWKYVYNFWRPITGIRLGDTDANDATIADASWEPLGAPGGDVLPDFTPPFPAYASGHSTFGGAVFRVLKHFYGTDNISFEFESEELPGVMRSFTSFSEAALENALSRIYLGVHWRFDCEEGIKAGEKVGDYIYANYLRPIPDADLDGDGDCDAQDLLLFQQVWHEKL